MHYGDGKKLTCCGDEPFHDCEKEYVYGSEWLLHEAFCLYSQADIFQPYEKNHSTVADACKLAEELKIKNLVLYHTEDKNLSNRKSLYYDEGKNISAETCIFQMTLRCLIFCKVLVWNEFCKTVNFYSCFAKYSAKQ